MGNINIEMQKKSSLKHVVLRGGVLAFSVGRDGGCTLERVVGMEMVGATGGASKERIHEMNVWMERVVATGGASPLPYEKWVG